MAARVIHFGSDDCHRLTVLRSAGFAVAECSSLSQFRKALKAVENPDAVCVVEGNGVKPEAVGEMARANCSAPVVLFRTSYRNSEEAHFDLIVPTLTPPEIWLREIETLINRSRKLQARSLVLIENGREIRRESAAAREKSQAERARSRGEYLRGQAPSFGDLGDADPQSE